MMLEESEQGICTLMHECEKEKVESSDVPFPLSSTQGVLVAGGSNFEHVLTPCAWSSLSRRRP